MPGMWITEYHDFQFDSAKFTVTQNGKQTDQTIEGRKVVIDYATIKSGAQIPCCNHTHLQKCRAHCRRTGD